MSYRFHDQWPKRFGAIVILVAAIVTLTACGGAAAPAPTAVPTKAPASAPTSAPAPTGALQGDATRGTTVFSSKCASCHSIGSGTVIGPDLKGVTQRRDNAWLVKWIKGPSAVVNSGDATAKQLVQQYGSTMPTLGLDDQQIADVIAYIQSKS